MIQWPYVHRRQTGTRRLGRAPAMPAGALTRIELSGWVQKTSGMRLPCSLTVRAHEVPSRLESLNVTRMPRDAYIWSHWFPLNDLPTLPAKACALQLGHWAYC